MTVDEIIDRIKSDGSLKITNKSDIPHGIKLVLNNGAIVNCYNSGKYTVQGKDQEKAKAIICNDIINNNRNIFVVYGHDETSRLQLEAMLRRWDLNPIILDQLASSGQTIIEKLEEYSEKSGYAIVLATPDDQGKANDETDYKSRVRQNVVLELGMFLAKLGRSKVAILLKESDGFEKPSDIQGLIYISFKENVEDVEKNLIKELSQQGYKIDPAKL